MNNTIRATAVALFLSAPLFASFPTLAHEGYDKALQAYSCVDYPKAIGLFKTYAEQGHGLSQYMMGIMTEQGQGVTPDVDAAYDWYMNAAKQGITDAYFALADMYKRGISVQKDPIRAYAWFDLAKQGGHNLAGDMLNSLDKELQADQIAQAKEFGKEWLAKMGR
ncbi:MAG: sel1 repeat family protein [Thiobacillus sp.]|nr:sel1 repeat family protein [Thiobacillus sp.]